MDGFFAGESVPVNEKLAKIILQLHISEQTGRGVPAIVEVYGKDIFRFSENNIKVTIPFERIENAPVNAPVSGTITQVNGENTQVNTQVGDNSTQVEPEQANSITNRILVFCAEPKGMMEIAGHLGYKERKTVRKYIEPLLEQGRIAMTVPEKPNSRNQKYITIK